MVGIRKFQRRDFEPQRLDGWFRPPNQQFSTKEPHEAPRESRLFSESVPDL